MNETLTVYEDGQHKSAPKIEAKASRSLCGGGLYPSSSVSSGSTWAKSNVHLRGVHAKYFPQMVSAILLLIFLIIFVLIIWSYKHWGNIS